MTTPPRVAALFVDGFGVYATMPEVDVWPVSRDARRYHGPLPVVAHPPCQRWGRLGAINYRRHGGDHNRPGNDGGCFAAALAAVRRWGGVLEHPADSHAWDTFGLPVPLARGWVNYGDDWSCEVSQSAYGHKARKRTWLLCCSRRPPQSLLWGNVPGTHQVGFQDQRGKARNKPTLTKADANATPIDFARILIHLAIRAGEDFEPSLAPLPAQETLAL